MKGDGALFGYFQTPGTFEDALEGMSTEKVNAEWQEIVKPFFKIPESSAPGETMIEMPAVFHLDYKKG